MSAADAKLNEQAESGEEIRSRPCPECCLCGAGGKPLYEGLTDRVANAPGQWNLKRCPNPECGLLWLDPMPLEEDIAMAYEGYFTHAAPEDAADASPPAAPGAGHRAAELCRSAYRAWRFNCGDDTGKPLRWLFALPILLSRIECDALDIPLRYLAVSQKGRMLDVGCGDGYALNMAQELGWNTEGVDFDAQAVDAARRKGLSVRLGSLAAQRYPDESFDLVLMNHVIEHLHDPLGTLREIRRVLAVGGTLAVTTPNAESWGHRHFGPSWLGLHPPQHLQIFTGNGLATLARRAGFVQSAVSSTLRTTPFNFVQSPLIRRGGRVEWLRSLTHADVRYGRAASLVEMLMRLWDPLAADELLLEARK
ncbi:class I SAM-dependent methyltransferase [Candidatus Binatus soli]|uniref:class I SAM-dependent methyltransferase n=1 Tax=Candidatus Binatus soli TaxID=1953413 RepID=UPI003D09EDBF